MTPQLKSYYILHQNRILRQHFYVLYQLFPFVAKNVILAFEYYVDEYYLNIIEYYLFLASNSCCVLYFFFLFLPRR